MTIIVECGFQAHATLLKRVFTIFGLKKSVKHEHIRLLQCARCWRFGHTGARCNTDQIICRKCTGNHISSACDSVQRKLECVNCMESNKTGTKYKVDHAPNNDRCPIKLQRINCLKQFIIKQKQQIQATQLQT